MLVTSDGANGINLIQKSLPDLVINDLMIPGVDGFSVVETMKQDERLSNIPIVVITAKELRVRERD